MSEQKVIPKTENQISIKGLGDIEDLLKGRQDPLDLMAEKLVEVLFDKKNLLMTSRLDRNYAKMIIRNSIVNDFYLAYYSRCKVVIEIESISVPPYYRKKEVIIDTPNKNDVYKRILNDLNDKLLMITISEGGKGRVEVVDIIKGLIGEVAQDRKSLLP